MYFVDLQSCLRIKANNRVRAVFPCTLVRAVFSFPAVPRAEAPAALEAAQVF